ncbi:MAG: MerR family transcriptional regulator [Pseudomonadales bacterium]
MTDRGDPQQRPEHAGEPHLLPISVVSRLTGISIHSLRKWESRYGLVTPKRTQSGRRAYTAADVEMLLLIQQLLGLGYQPGQLAGLLPDALRNLLPAIPPSVPPDTPLISDRAPRPLTIVGPVLGAVARRSDLVADTGVALCFVDDDAADWLDASHDDGDLLIECPTLNARLVNCLLKCQKQRAGSIAVVFGFATSAAVERLNRAGLVCYQAPLTAQQLPRLVRDLRGQSRLPENLLDAAPPSRRFSDVQIARAAAASQALDCECPAHVAQLLSSLNAFERYSRECAETDPQQRALHGFLGRVAGLSRGLFEEALERLALAERVPLYGPNTPADSNADD